MKNRNFTNIFVEGTDGVGKNTLQAKLLKYFDYRIPVYDRGELSNMVYAEKYGRPFSAMQRHLPFLYVLLTCEEKKLAERIRARSEAQHWTEADTEAELLKIKDQEIFLRLVPAFAKDYHLIVLDTTDLNADETLAKCVELIEDYQNKLKADDPATFTAWNKLYESGCEQLGLEFKVINNQPYINNIAILGELNNQNGVYETFSDKKYPHNFIYMLGYSQTPKIVPFEMRKDDFTYIINSKILSRHEVYDYLEKFIENNKTCLAGKNTYMIEHPFIKTMERPVGDPLITKMSEAKATVYMARKMEYVKYLSVRLYESILAENVIFVDKKSDLNNEILKEIYGEDDLCTKLLYVDEDDICSKYDYVMAREDLRLYIIKKQHEYYDKIKKEIFERAERGDLF